MSTIDPGMADPIKQSSQDVEAKPGEPDEKEIEEHDFTDPSRWWAASTICPLLAGTFGPIASGFNICALVFEWRLYVPPGGTEEHGVRIKDPAWVIVRLDISKHISHNPYTIHPFTRSFLAARTMLTIGRPSMPFLSSAL